MECLKRFKIMCLNIQYTVYMLEVCSIHSFIILFIQSIMFQKSTYMENFDWIGLLLFNGCLNDNDSKVFFCVCL